MNEPTIHVGTVGEGIWRSSDSGATWRRACDGMFVECDVRALAVHPLDPRTLYAGTNEGVYRTEDGGDNWARLEVPLDGAITWSLLIVSNRANIPNGSDVLLAGTRPAGIFRSTDGGRTWRKADANLAQPCARIMFNRVTTLRADPLEPQWLWAGVEIDGVWQSRDLGESWTKVGSGLSSADIHGMAIVPLGGGKRRIAATTNNDLNLSHDDGVTWEPQRVGERFDHPYCRGLAQRPDRPEVLFLGNGDGPPGYTGAAWRSGDGGLSWQRLALPALPNSTIWDFAFHPAQPERIYAYSVSGEVYHSADGGNRWEKLLREFGEIRSLAWTP
ncbi:MAG TPA: hypothetical protein VGX78_03265 [Pirellulales bacterium]|jgi:photosystem II stability/assembly factor-like uncharacterized protein|nr:hypothetical protein [Pirellulales bacterium]